MKSILVVAVLVGVVLAGSAWAQFGTTADEIGLPAGIARSFNGGSWIRNPAMLGNLGIEPREGNSWGHDLVGTYGQVDDTSLSGASWSGWSPDRNFGVGAGVFDIEDGGNVFGIGAGIGFQDSPFSVGANAVVINPDFGSDEVVLNAGGLYRGSGWAIGATVLDVTDELGAGQIVNVGGAAEIGDRLVVAIDVLDVTDESTTGPYYNGGVELAVGSSKTIRLQAGAVDTGSDHEITLGAQYQKEGARWHAGVGLVNIDPDPLWVLSFGGTL